MNVPLPAIGVHLPVNDRTAPIEDLAVAVEERGLATLAVGELSHVPVVLGDEPRWRRVRRVPDPFVLLSAAAARTTRIRLATMVCLAAEYHPLQLANAVASLDLVSAGRLDLGVGYGWVEPEMRHRGVDPATRRERLHEHVLAMRELWTRDVAAFDGRFVRFGESWSWPKPVQPRMPVRLGCGPHPRNVRDVVELGDGWISNLPLARRAEIGPAVARLRAAARRVGRDPAELRMSALLLEPVREDLSPAAFRRWLPDRRVLEQYTRAGVDELVIGVPLPDARCPEAALDALAERYPAGLDW